MQLVLIIILCAVALIFFIIFKSHHLPALIKRAEELMEEDEYGRANEIVKKILERKKDFVPARFLKARILSMQGQLLLAISEFNNVLFLPDLKKYLDEIEIHYHLAGLYSEIQNWQKEIEEYRKILIFNPDDIKANHRIGHAHFKKKDYDRAMEHLLKAVTSDPNLRDCYLPIGVSCFMNSDFDKSEEFLLKALNEPGNKTIPQFYLGSIFKIKKDYENAIQMLESPRVNSEFFLQSLYLLGEIFFERNQFKAAIEHLEKGLNNLEDGDDFADEYRYLLAECFEQDNKISEAVFHWEKIAANNSGFRSTNLKIKSYIDIIRNETLMALFTTSIDELQPLLIDIISGINFNIINKKKISPNEYQYKAFNIKRINEPPLLVYFNRTTKEITEGQIIDFQKLVSNEKCRSGIYISTSKFSLKAKSSSSSKMIELYDQNFVVAAIEKINSRKRGKK